MGEGPKHETEIELNKNIHGTQCLIRAFKAESRQFLSKNHSIHIFRHDSQDTCKNKKFELSSATFFSAFCRQSFHFSSVFLRSRQSRRKPWLSLKLCPPESYHRQKLWTIVWPSKQIRPICGKGPRMSLEKVAINLDGFALSTRLNNE